ncbi:PadR family transcriptional regulator [Pseudonocardia parietis]|uniref:DNA-binding PadR family transcriptional regulator n=1 Tax=Pseudonocardia parietis TaxID=570936 RepID=A0ABS4W5F4_9PSEU|nr:PadR family transcriptional regulator [Pseudonocardia parietis]MBP2371138.1 DNA-binding PadR family transcriptional regulator [Pseudonocardia parietis]
MSLPHALLGLLAVEPGTGYDLTRMFDSDLGRYAWQAGHTSIYPELAKLAANGLVEVTAQGPRGAKTYDVTEAGRAELRRWMLAPQQQGRVRNEPVLRMFLIAALPRPEALELLDRIEQEAEQGAAELREVRAEHPDTAPMLGPEGLGQLAAEFGVRQYEVVRDWARWAADRLRAEN